MRDYEAVCIFRPDLPEDKIDAMLSKLEKKIKAGGGEMGTIAKWGRRNLPFAYRRYKGGREGFFVLVNFKGDKGVPSEVENTLKISEDVIRCMVVRAVALPPAAIEGAEEKVEISPEMLLPGAEESEEKENG